ncbi:response regulator transcription factor [Miniphocaeibacter halophilus]|uniref:Response regulator transcription factor n=1 Tax=Miniphocaeibacter halophilus TaxID=2931922 RepID=A0AC61MT13_9FIRM|nr:response regulator transcription factor [Miniphocaeibacter halophilus]QQK08488.1 response regulator transcription factor [Miniphocaeibacter halophilus]
MKAKILFMEDELNIREVLSEYMNMAGMEVVAVENGEEAIKKLNTGIFDIAILDIMVPKISGLEVLTYIKEKNIEIGIIMLTALGDEKTQLEAFNNYADDYIVKPISPILLLKRIETLLRRLNYSKVKEEYTKGLYINKDKYQAYYNQKSLELTLTEFLLLDCLREYPERVFSREQLIYRIFNEDYIGNDRIIDSHIKNLRKKLPKNYIKTVIGIGYSFREEVDEIK